MREKLDPVERGSILTADGTVLAADVMRFDVEAYPYLVTRKYESGRYVGLSPEALAAKLGPLVGVDQAELVKRLDQPRVTWTVLMKDATWEQVNPIQKLIDKYWIDGIDLGIALRKYYQRSYPAGNVAGNLVGYPYGDLYTGLELTLNQPLTGQDGLIKREVGAKGQPIPGGRVESVPGVPGCDATLTIDAGLQYAAQRVVDTQVETYQAMAGMAVVIDVKTGEILALADSGSPEPAKPSGQTVGYQNSRAIENQFEPGSTGKVVSVAMLIEEGAATPTSQYSVPSSVTVDGQVFEDSHPHPVEPLTLAGILAESSNAGIVLAAQSISAETRYQYLKRFGFAQPTGIELQIEAIGVVHKPGEPPAYEGAAYWDGRTNHTVLYGQAMSANALQITEVFATLGNGGLRLQPHLIKGITCADGEFKASQLADPVNVVSSGTASQVISMMETVVESGTGGSAQIDGYRIAGKTGTSEMIQPDGSVTYVGSFAGLLPAEDPQIAIGVFIVDPRSGGYYGATVAGPAFEQLAAAAIDHFGVAPSVTPPAALATRW
jgi:cell division protein FtsI (penicillin-binding protein 3)